MLTAIGDVMRRLYERGWISTRDGNVSVMRRGFLYITPSGGRKTILHPEHLIKIKLGKDRQIIVPEGSSPSGELHMHYLIQRDVKGVRSVVHGHPTHVTAAMYRGFDLQQLASQFPEIFRYTRVGPSVAPIPAITKPLGDATARALGVDGSKIEYDIVGQHNHGVTAVARDPWTAYEHIERMNHVCEIVLLSGVTPDEVERRHQLGQMAPSS